MAYALTFFTEVVTIMRSHGKPRYSRLRGMGQTILGAIWLWGASGLRFAVSRLRSSNDAAEERHHQGDHHVDTTQVHRHDAGRRRSAGHNRATGAAAARRQAHDRRRPGAFMESEFAGLALGSRRQAAIA